MNKILLIEDDELIANAYRNKFTVENFQVETAPDGESGIEAIKSFHPDVVILDLMLPKMSGLELLQQIRAQDATKQLPVIVFSNTYLSNMVQQAWKAGATKCLSKASSTPKQVIEVVRGLTNKPAGGSSAPVSHTKSHSHGHAHSHGHGHAKAVETEDDTAFQTEVRRRFLQSLPGTLAACRSHLQSVVKNTDETERAKFLDELYRRIRGLTANAGVAGMLDIAQMADAVEAFLKELCEKPKSVNASTLRTLALAIDFLGVMFDHLAKHGFSETSAAQSKTNILVVDDEAISRRAVTYALEKAKLSSTAVDNPQVALDMLAENPYDLVFLDVDMPGMNGFELCTKLRALARNKTTPVVFVTSLNDFESRAHSTMSGGNDLIAKPFLFMELAVKALVYIMKGRMAKAGK